MIRIQLPMDGQTAAGLRAGQSVLLCGKLLTARDAAHQRLHDALKAGRELPVDVNGQTLYYTGPCPAPKGYAIGPCGPTTSSRMDVFTPELLALGLNGMLGKGERSRAVIEAMKARGAVYFAALGGAGALLCAKVKSSRIVAYEDLGTEAIRELVVEDFPAIVVIDAQGNNLYQSGPAAYRADAVGKKERMDPVDL